jgi:predicted GH43/DUF377 family glycosyl hydrolase
MVEQPAGASRRVADITSVLLDKEEEEESSQLQQQQQGLWDQVYGVEDTRLMEVDDDDETILSGSPSPPPSTIKTKAPDQVPLPPHETKRVCLVFLRQQSHMFRLERSK